MPRDRVALVVLLVPNACTQVEIIYCKVKRESILRFRSHFDRIIQLYIPYTRYNYFTLLAVLGHLYSMVQIYKDFFESYSHFDQGSALRQFKTMRRDLPCKAKRSSPRISKLTANIAGLINPEKCIRSLRLKILII